MNTEEYRSQLTALLRSLPREEREEVVSFYMESIADRIDEGMSEEEAVASMVSPGQAAEAIIAEAGEKRKALVPCEASVGRNDEPDLPEGVVDIEGAEDANVESGEDDPASPDGFFARAKKRRFTPLEWVALIVTSPLWLTLLIAAVACALGLVIGIAAIALALYICAWTLIACLWLIGGAFVVSVPVVLVFAVWGLQVGNAPFSLVNIGYSLMLFGGGMWVLKAALAVTRAFLRWQKESVAARFSRRGRDFAEETDLADAPNATNLAHGAAGISTGSGSALEDGAAVEAFGAGTAGASNIAARTKPYALFFRICWVLALGGLACALAGFLASGLDWRVFLTSHFSLGKMYLGGVEVAHPEQLFLSPHFLIELASS